jgi:hypothetical protein
MMSSVHVPDTLPGRPPGRSSGLSVQAVNSAVVANFRVSGGSYGWDEPSAPILGGPEEDDRGHRYGPDRQPEIDARFRERGAASKAEAFNRIEKLRDPSHVHALPTEGLGALLLDAGLAAPG